MIRGKTTHYYIALIAIVSSLIISGCVSHNQQAPRHRLWYLQQYILQYHSTPVPTQEPGTRVEVLNAPARSCGRVLMWCGE